MTDIISHIPLSLFHSLLQTISRSMITYKLHAMSTIPYSVEVYFSMIRPNQFSGKNKPTSTVRQCDAPPPRSAIPAGPEYKSAVGAFRGSQGTLCAPNCESPVTGLGGWVERDAIAVSWATGGGWSGIDRYSF